MAAMNLVVGLVTVFANLALLTIIGNAIVFGVIAIVKKAFPGRKTMYPRRRPPKRRGGKSSYYRIRNPNTYQKSNNQQQIEDLKKLKEELLNTTELKLDEAKITEDKTKKLRK